MPDLFPDDRFSPPDYSEKEIQALRIKQAHFLSDHILFLLSDGKALCVPVSVCAPLEAAPQEQRYQWQVIMEGRGVVWHAGALQEYLSLRGLLEHPEARVGDLAGRESPFPLLPSN